MAAPQGSSLHSRREERHASRAAEEPPLTLTRQTRTDQTSVHPCRTPWSTPAHVSRPSACRGQKKMFPTVSLESYDGPSASFPSSRRAHLCLSVRKSTINAGGAAHSYGCMTNTAHIALCLCSAALLLHVSHTCTHMVTQMHGLARCAIVRALQQVVKQRL